MGVIVYAVVYTDFSQGEDLIEHLYDNRDAAEKHAAAMREMYSWVAGRYQVQERMVASEFVFEVTEA